jgi:hypothetical protein
MYYVYVCIVGSRLDHQSTFIGIGATCGRIVPHVPETRFGYRVSVSRWAGLTIAREVEGEDDDEEGFFDIDDADVWGIVPHTRVPETRLGYRIMSAPGDPIIAVEVMDVWMYAV